MEALNDRFNALQETLLDIYESGKDDIDTQILHWNCLRKEQIVLHYARKHGIRRVGYQHVPPLAVTETKAKEAIGMVLVLESLKKSPYGNESWTLVNTSLETYRTPPSNCFKKGPSNIEVRYDNDPENIMHYTVWDCIYFQNADEQWEKVKGHVDYMGAYYMDGEHKQYYIHFADDAARYSKTGIWEVRSNEETLFAPVTSSTPPGGEQGVGVPTSSTDASASPATTTSAATTTYGTTREDRGQQQQQQKAKRRRYGRKASSPTGSTTSPRKAAQGTRSRSRNRRRKTQGPKHRSGRKRSSSDSSRSSNSRSSRKRARSPGGGSGRRSSSSTASKRARSRSQTPRRGKSGSRSRSRSKSKSRHSEGGGVSPSEVGRDLQTVSGRHLGRLEQLLADARDPPIILFKGAANTLKCYRYRERQRLKGFYKWFSTTWSWVGSEDCTRIGRARMIVSFTSYSQRQEFTNRMKIPKGVDWCFGNFDKL